MAVMAAIVGGYKLYILEEHGMAPRTFYVE
jgi:hypothetical protein